MLSLMDTIVFLVVKVLWKLISLICFRVYLEVNVHKNPTCFSRWSVREEEYNDTKDQVNTNDRLKETINRINDMVKDESATDAINQLNKVSWEQLM